MWFAASSPCPLLREELGSEFGVFSEECDCLVVWAKESEPV
jgi:hypothetical protein